MSRLFLGLLFSLSACALPAQTLQEVQTIRIGEAVVELEVARTSVQHRTGLMNRRALAADAGMLFVFPAPRPIAMWMKNTYIDLDAAFVDACGRITQIVTMKKGTLDLHHSRTDAAHVIEMNAGWFARHKIRPGAQIPELIHKGYCRSTASP